LVLATEYYRLSTQQGNSVEREDLGCSVDGAWGE
jgi:hypothetical protein